MPSPEPQTWYALFKDFQNILGTLVGFGGVCLTLWFNARVTDRRRAHEIDHDRNTTRITLASELTVIQRSLRDWNEVLDGVAKEGHVALPRSFDAEGGCRGYRSALAKIGLLTETEIQTSVFAYSQYEALSKMSHDMQNQFNPDNVDPAFRAAFQAYRTALASTKSAVDSALDALAKHLVPKQTTTPH